MTMNRIQNEKWPWIAAAHGMRTQLFESLSDADLAFSPGGQAMTFGALCREMGETEHSYTQSLKSLKQEWSYRHPEADVASHVDHLKTWFQTLDDEVQMAITTFLSLSVIIPMALQIRETMVLQRVELEGKGSPPHF